jgi:hypothetical protein
MTAIAGRLGEFWAAFTGTTPTTGVVAGETTPDDTTYENPTSPDITNPAPAPGLGLFCFPCASLVDFSVSGNVDELETTVHNDDNATSPVHSTARSYIPNFHDETADASMRYDEADACQEALLISAFGSLLFHYWYIPNGDNTATGGGKVIWGDAFSTSFNPSSPLDDVSTMDFSLRLSASRYADLLAP